MVQLLKANRKKCSRFAAWMWMFPRNFFFLLFANLFYCHTQVIVTEVLGGGKFYVQTIGDQKATSLQQQLAALNLQEVPLIGAFSPKKGDIVLAQFSADNSWNRAMVSVWNMPSFKIQYELSLHSKIRCQISLHSYFCKVVLRNNSC